MGKVSFIPLDNNIKKLRVSPLFHNSWGTDPNVINLRFQKM
jgi:hypothetical protein